ncbi:hypothetical protein GPECTOR_26g604 [Gonium pectorale]|uniref:Methyltransferase type 11 domain-containing protein n=1 Tax=Gonium pectorale TaxID=33097 RepID=A0A150GFT0_GONPE|nr:hypothetical protein GPECTOR_26g604 [Gonium pectorale]|eukprot:KXZ48701.1 hypothetical protein GPECTOR_26g604 [Gonium pectorale]
MGQDPPRARPPLADEPSPADPNSTSTSAFTPAASNPATAPEDPSALFLDAAQSAAYAAHRPTYPKSMYDAIYAAAVPNRQPPFNDLAVVDVATGSGQALGPMPADFGTCYALDVSEAQLGALALPPELRQRVTLRQGDAHATGLPDASVDLVTVGQALHWFRLDEFYRECRRVLRPNGVLAAWTYDFGRLSGCEGAQQLYEQFHSGTLAPYWASGRRLVDAEYVGIEPGPQHFEETRRVQLPLPTSLTLDQLEGQIRSWSGYHSYLKANPDKPDPLVGLRQSFSDRLAILGGAAAAGAAATAVKATEVPLPRLTLTRTLTLLLALRPRPL